VEQSVTQELDVLLKELQHVLKGVSTNTLLTAQLEALKEGWAASREVSELVAQAHKFVLLHNIRAETRSFAGFLRHGLLFALREPPQRLDFLHVLVPFVQRASLEDLKDTSVQCTAEQNSSTQRTPTAVADMHTNPFSLVCLCVV
jgi:hypothetical protein